MTDDTRTTVRVTTTRHDAVAVVTIDRPPVNALDDATVTELAAVVSALVGDQGVRCVVFQGAGRMFSAGADIGTLRDSLADPGGPDAAARHVTRIQDLFAAVADLPVPTVAAVHRAAAGGGLELALACDLRIAGATARLGLPELGIGLIPAGGGTQRATRLLGPAQAARLVFEGELLDAAEALRIGLVQYVVPDADVPAEALRLAQRIAGRSRAALAAAKRCLSAPDMAHGFAAELSAARELLATPETARLLASF
ncbi:MAG TPA: enoyl-CoA hydratase/isomerase family protein [Trebonia sp.]|jgi:enoyl-CoA hydratase|nr:enoyl-CoA hydratase/isomerase family protein [Trebonia sp.]